jgi:hypothetical protein
MIAPRLLGWTLLVGGLLAQFAAYLIAIAIDPEATVAAWLAVVGIVATMCGTLVIGALRNDRLSRPASVAAVVLLVIPLIGFGAALLLPAETATGPLWLGLPRRAAMVLLGIGLLPLFVLPFAYARDSGDVQLDADALSALRAEAIRLREHRD